MVNEVGINEGGYTEERLYSVFQEWYIASKTSVVSEDLFSHTTDARADSQTIENSYARWSIQEQAFNALVFDITQDNIQMDDISEEEYYEKIEETELYLKTHPSVFTSILKNKFLKYIAFNRFYAVLEEREGVRVINEPFQSIW